MAEFNLESNLGSAYVSGGRRDRRNLCLPSAPNAPNRGEADPQFIQRAAQRAAQRGQSKGNLESDCVSQKTFPQHLSLRIYQIKAIHAQ